jgi:hypothetical protein
MLMIQQEQVQPGLCERPVLARAVGAVKVFEGRPADAVRDARLSEDGPGRAPAQDDQQDPEGEASDHRNECWGKGHGRLRRRGEGERENRRFRIDVTDPLLTLGTTVRL